LFEASFCMPAASDGAVGRDTLRDIIEAYDEYLVSGLDSGNSVAQLISRTLPSPRVARNSSATKHSAIRYFLRLSERVRAQMLELTEVGFCNFIDAQKLFIDLGEKKAIPIFQRQALVANSMMAGLISGGPKFIDEAILPTSTPDLTYDHERAFPFDKVQETLQNFRTHRDKALYALCAASGCRISEALQLLWEDIDFSARTVRLVDPKSRPNSPSYIALTPKERDRLAWKGRATTLTLLIDPFATWFFEALAEYLRHEYIPHGRHNFVFQYDDGVDLGAPYFLASVSSRNSVFRRAVKLTGVMRIQGPHSLRHMYGTYLLNYFPRPDGTYGLPIGLVQKIMGHRQIKDTAKYARYDRDLLYAELQHANMALFCGDEALSVNQIIRAALLKRLAEVENKLEQEGLLK
jgi:integrase/recombinase XerD